VAKIDLKKELKHLYQPTEREIVQVEVPLTKKSAWGLACVLTYETLKRREEDYSQKVHGFFATTLPFPHK
jgi:hypothetical protein